MGQSRQYDWDTIRQEYILDPLATLRGLATKHGISRRVVQRRASPAFESWAKQRADHIAKLVPEVRRKVAKELTDLITTAMRRTVEMSQAAAEAAVERYIKDAKVALLDPAEEITTITQEDPKTGAVVKKVLKSREQGMDGQALQRCLAEHNELLKDLYKRLTDEGGGGLIREITIA